MRDRESFLRRVEERLARMSRWLADRRRGEQTLAGDLHGRTEALRRELARARQAFGGAAHEDLARVHAALEDMKSDYDAPTPHFALRRTELEAFRHHLHTTARLARELSTADSPGWNAANEEYERSWAELERAFEAEGDAAPP